MNNTPLSEANAQRDPEEVLRQLYRSMWDFCAGWNRVAFRAPQIDYIVRTHQVRITLASLGELDAMAMLVDGWRFITLNRRLCPNAGRRAVEHNVWDVVSQRLGHRARFVLLHELAHVRIHRDVPNFWRTVPVKRLGKARRIAEHGLLLPKHLPQPELEAAAVREVEADFFSLVALVPDYRLWRMEVVEKKELTTKRVADYIRGRDPHAPLENLEALADYRILLFRKFAHLFLKVSLEPFTTGYGEPRRPATIDGVDPEEVRHVTGADPTGVLSPIVTEHPRLQDDARPWSGDWTHDPESYLFQTLSSTAQGAC